MEISFKWPRYYLCLLCFQLCNGNPITPNVTEIDSHTKLLTGVVSLLLTICFLVFLAACLCCQRRKTFQVQEPIKKFRNSPVVASSLSDIDHGHVNPIANGEFTIFSPLSPAHNNNVFHANEITKARVNEELFENGCDIKSWFGPNEENFPRNKLKYIKELGTGWFGKVVQGAAQDVGDAGQTWSPVVVRILEATSSQKEKILFLQDAAVYRCSDHTNILSLLGRSLETVPFLLLQEYCPQGDLKGYLQSNKADAEKLLSTEYPLIWCCQLTSAVKYIHERNFVQHDLASRNCQLTANLTLKLGDYGLGPFKYPSDYYQGLPTVSVRWSAPETLVCTQTTIQPKKITPEANVWSLGVTMWEICECGQQPYSTLSDDEVISQVLGPPCIRLGRPTYSALYTDYIFRLMQSCWTSPESRSTAWQIDVMLTDLLQVHRNTTYNTLDVDEFDRRWQSCKPNTIVKTDHIAETLLTPEINISKALSPSLNNLHGSLDNLAEETKIFIENETLNDSLTSQKTSISDSSDHENNKSTRFNFNTNPVFLRTASSGSETEEENWRNKVERGAYTEKVRQKSRSVADLMILTHVDYSESESETPLPSLDYRVNYKNVRLAGLEGPANLENANLIYGSEGNLLSIQDTFQEEIRKLKEERRDSLPFVPDTISHPSFSNKEISNVVNPSRLLQELNSSVDITPPNQVFNVYNVTIDSFNPNKIHNKLSQIIDYNSEEVRDVDCQKSLSATNESERCGKLDDFSFSNDMSYYFEDNTQLDIFRCCDSLHEDCEAINLNIKLGSDNNKNDNQLNLPEHEMDVNECNVYSIKVENIIDEDLTHELLIEENEIVPLPTSVTDILDTTISKTFNDIKEIPLDETNKDTNTTVLQGDEIVLKKQEMVKIENETKDVNDDLQDSVAKMEEILDHKGEENKSSNLLNGNKADAGIKEIVMESQIKPDITKKKIETKENKDLQCIEAQMEEILDQNEIINIKGKSSNLRNGNKADEAIKEIVIENTLQPDMAKMEIETKDNKALQEQIKEHSSQILDISNPKEIIAEDKCIDSALNLSKESTADEILEQIVLPIGECTIGEAISFGNSQEVNDDAITLDNNDLNNQLTTLMNSPHIVPNLYEEQRIVKNKLDETDICNKESEIKLQTQFNHNKDEEDVDNAPNIHEECKTRNETEYTPNLPSELEVDPEEGHIDNQSNIANNQVQLKSDLISDCKDFDVSTKVPEATKIEQTDVFKKNGEDMELNLGKTTSDNQIHQSKIEVEELQEEFSDFITDSKMLNGEADESKSIQRILTAEEPNSNEKEPDFPKPNSFKKESEPSDLHKVPGDIVEEPNSFNKEGSPSDLPEVILGDIVEEKLGNTTTYSGSQHSEIVKDEKQKDPDLITDKKHLNHEDEVVIHEEKRHSEREIEQFQSPKQEIATTEQKNRNSEGTPRNRVQKLSDIILSNKTLMESLNIPLDEDNQMRTSTESEENTEVPLVNFDLSLDQDVAKPNSLTHSSIFTSTPFKKREILSLPLEDKFSSINRYPSENNQSDMDFSLGDENCLPEDKNLNYSLETWDNFLGSTLDHQNEHLETMFDSFSSEPQSLLFLEGDMCTQENEVGDKSPILSQEDPESNATYTISNKTYTEGLNDREYNSSLPEQREVSEVGLSLTFTKEQADILPSTSEDPNKGSFENGGGWFLHPQPTGDLCGEIQIQSPITDSYIGFGIDDEIMSAIRNELLTKLPHAQGASAERVKEEEEDWDTGERNEVFLRYNVYNTPLSPIPEESCMDDGSFINSPKPERDYEDTDWSGRTDTDTLTHDIESNSAHTLESPLRGQFNRHTPSQDSCCSNDTLFNLEELICATTELDKDPEIYLNLVNDIEEVDIDGTSMMNNIDENETDRTEGRIESVTEENCDMMNSKLITDEFISKERSHSVDNNKIKPNTLDVNGFSVNKHVPLPSPEDNPWRQLPASVLNMKNITAVTPLAIEEKCNTSTAKHISINCNKDEAVEYEIEKNEELPKDPGKVASKASIGEEDDSHVEQDNSDKENVEPFYENSEAKGHIYENTEHPEANKSNETHLYENTDNETHLYENTDNETHLYENTDNETHLYQNSDNEILYETDNEKLYENANSYENFVNMVNDKNRLECNVDDNYMHIYGYEDDVPSEDENIYGILTDIRFSGPTDSQLMSTSFSENNDEQGWESGSDSRSSSSGEFIWKEGEHEESLKALRAVPQDVMENIKPMEGIMEDAYEESDVSSTFTEDEETPEFVPSAWDKFAMPSKSALKSPEKTLKKAEERKPKGVWFKKQKYHCIYEYPKEPESPVLQSQDLWKPQADLKSFADWEFDGEVFIPSQSSEESTDYTNRANSILSNHNLYQLTSITDFIPDISLSTNTNGDFFISSSTQPFHAHNLSSQFFPGNSNWTFENATPDSEVEDITPGSTTDSNEYPSTNTMPTLKQLASEAIAKRKLSKLKNNEVMGGLRHTRNKLKLDLPPSPNAFSSEKLFTVVPAVEHVIREKPAFTTFGKSRFMVQHVDTPPNETAKNVSFEALPYEPLNPVIKDPSDLYSEGFDVIERSLPKKEDTLSNETAKYVSFEAVPYEPLNPIIKDHSDLCLEGFDVIERSLLKSEEDECKIKVEVVRGEASLLDSGDEDSGIESASTLERKISNSQL